jgi:molybdopterin-guanine dinucleotide biosynthesis protein
MLRIQVTGPINSGKTTVALIIEEALRQHGFRVRNLDPDVTMNVKPPTLDDDRIRATAKKSHIMSFTIETNQPERRTSRHQDE